MDFTGTDFVALMLVILADKPFTTCKGDTLIRRYMALSGVAQMLKG